MSSGILKRCYRPTIPLKILYNQDLLSNNHQGLILVSYFLKIFHDFISELSVVVAYCYGDIPYDVTAWTLPDSMNSD